MQHSSFARITLVSVTGLSDARGAVMALQLSQQQMQGTQALLCCPQCPQDLPAGITHFAIAPMNYQEYSWFVMFVLWHMVATEFALIVQDDGWVLNADNWNDEFLDYDYIGAPIHLARVESTQGTQWLRQFEWSQYLDQPGYAVTPVQNGGFSLRSQRLMRALIDHPDIRVEIPQPQVRFEPQLQMYWHNDAVNEDVQLSGILRPQLETKGIRFAPLALARSFAAEAFTPILHDQYNLLQLFGYHSRLCKLKSLSPLTVISPLTQEEVAQLYGVHELFLLLIRLGYRIEVAG